LEGGCWKSAQSGNSLAAYPTASTVLRGGDSSDAILLPDLLRDGSIVCKTGRKSTEGSALLIEFKLRRDLYRRGEKLLTINEERT